MATRSSSTRPRIEKRLQDPRVIVSRSGPQQLAILCCVPRKGSHHDRWSARAHRQARQTVSWHRSVSRPSWRNAADRADQRGTDQRCGSRLDSLDCAFNRVVGAKYFEHQVSTHCAPISLGRRRAASCSAAVACARMAERSQLFCHSRVTPLPSLSSGKLALNSICLRNRSSDAASDCNFWRSVCTAGHAL